MGVIQYNLLGLISKVTLKGDIVMSTMAHTHAPDSIAVQVSSLDTLDTFIYLFFSTGSMVKFSLFSLSQPCQQRIIVLCQKEK